MEETKYGVSLLGKNGNNTIYFSCSAHRLAFLVMMNSAEFGGSLRLHERTEIVKEDK